MTCAHRPKYHLLVALSRHADQARHAVEHQHVVDIKLANLVQAHARGEGNQWYPESRPSRSVGAGTRIALLIILAAGEYRGRKDALKLSIRERATFVFSPHRVRNAEPFSWIAQDQSLLLGPIQRPGKLVEIAVDMGGVDPLDSGVAFGRLDYLSKRQSGIPFVRVLWHFLKEADELPTTLARDRGDRRVGSEELIDPSLGRQIGFGRAVTA